MSKKNRKSNINVERLYNTFSFLTRFNSMAVYFLNDELKKDDLEGLKMELPIEYVEKIEELMKVAKETYRVFVSMKKNDFIKILREDGVTEENVDMYDTIYIICGKEEDSIDKLLLCSFYCQEITDSIPDNIEFLEQILQNAIRLENYEKAAEIRNRINKLKNNQK